MSKRVAQMMAGRRARFQRMTDCRLFHGWVQDMHRETVMVRASPDVLVKKGEKFLFEVVCADASISFEAKLETGEEALIHDPAASREEVQMRRRILAAANVEFEFVLTSNVHFLPATERPRLCSDSTLAVFASDHAKLNLIVLDVSEEGLGALASEHVASGTVGQITVTAPTGEMTFLARAIYSRSSVQMPGFFRVGFHIEEIHRIDQAKWGRLGA